MARSNTPKSYKCGFCAALLHNARTCPTKQVGAKSAASTLLFQRVIRRELRIQKKQEEAKKKAARNAGSAFRKKKASKLASSPVVIPDAPKQVFDAAGIPVVDVPPVISKIADQTYAIAGSTWVPVPDDTQLSDVAAFLSYVPRISTTTRQKKGANKHG
jgi:hypothetical protein